MTSLALLKIPCILMAMVGFHKTTTPPHAPPSAEENAPSTTLEIIVRQRSAAFVVKVICWAAAMAEIAVILASQRPRTSLSQNILSSLVFSELANTGSEIPPWKRIRPTTLFFAGTSAMATGSYIRWSCYRALGNLFTFEMSIRKNHRLVTVGPYSWVRHPGYTGVLMTVAGIVCWHTSPGSWARESGIFYTIGGKLVAFLYTTLVSAVTIGLLSRMSKEDALLKRKFGQDWEEWARSVPYRLVPGIY